MDFPQPKQPSDLRRILLKRREKAAATASTSTSRSGLSSSLQNATYQMIAYHQNVGSPFEQVMSNFNHPKTDNPVNISSQISICLDWLKNEASETKRSLGMTASDFCARKIVEISKDGRSKDSQELLARDKRFLLRMIVGVIHAVTSFDKTFFQNYLCSQTSHHPLEILWTLHAENIMTFDTYFYHKLVDVSICEGISSGILNLCNSSDLQTLPKRKDILKVLVGVLINEAFPLNSTRLSFTIQQEAQNVLHFLISKISAQNENEIPSLLPIELAMEYKLINREALQKTCLQQITFLLGNKPNYTASDAIKNQDQWTYSKLSPFKRALFKQFLVVLDATCVLNVIKNVLESEEFNWKTMLSFTATYLVCFGEAPNLLRNFITDTLKYGIDSAEIDSTIIAFLFARQSCYEGPCVFGTYPEWFELMFGSPVKSLANTRKSFTFLMKFLSDLVPYESAIHLKAHIIKAPFIPALCKPIFAEYSTLAKTRLVDLEQPIMTSSIFSDGSSLMVDKKRKVREAAEEVSKAVSIFLSSGKIPASVMEMTIFRRPYFISYFLPALLEPRVLPHKPDAKMKMITALKVAGKIPANLYQNYLRQCKKQSNTFKTNPIPMDEDDSKPPNMDLPMIEKLELLLNQFVEAVCNRSSQNLTESYGNKVSESLSMLSECLKMVTPEWKSDETPVTTCDTIHLDLQSPSLEEKHIQVTESLLNAASRAFLAVNSSPKPDYSWAYQFIRCLSVHVALLPSFYFHLWRLTSLQSDKLTDEQLISLAGILSQVALCKSDLPQVQVEVYPRGEILKGDFCNVLWKYLVCSNRNQMNFVLKLSCAFLKTIFYSVSELTDPKLNLVPESFVKKFVFLCERLHPETRFDAPTPCTWQEIIIYKSEAFAQLKNKYPLTLKDWLLMELSVDAEADSICLRERRLYQNWMLMFYQNVCPGGMTAREISSVLFQCLLEANVEISTEQKFQKCLKCHKDFSGLQKKFQNQHEIFLLLQKSLQEIMVLNCDDTNQMPWFLQELETVTNLKNCQNRQKLMTNAFVASEMMLSFPAHLILTDSLLIAPTDSAVDAFVFIINTIFKDHMNQGFSMSKNVTLHIFQALVSLKDTLSLNSLERFVHSSPLIWSSYLVHGECWGYNEILSILGSNHLSKILKLISLVWKNNLWWKDKVLLSELPISLSAASFASTLMQSNVFPDEKELQNLGMKISCAGFACLLSKITQNILNYRSVPSSLLVSAGQTLINSPQLFLTLSKQPSSSHLENIVCILPASSLTFRCVVIFRVLMEGCDLKKVCDFMSQVSFLEILLELHQEITNLFDQTVGLKASDMKENLSYCPHLKPLTMHDILNVTEFVRKILSNVSLQVLQQTNQNVWQSSDLALQKVFKERFQNKE